MKIIYSYLDQFIQPLPAINIGSELLTACGLEVEHIEKIESIKGGLAHVKAGEVLTVTPHPDADRLRVTQVLVETGGEPLQIVCGAPNVAEGQKVMVALVGAILYPNGSEEALKIKKSKIRGVESNGMICAEDELGIGTSHDGILILPAETPIGTEAAHFFNLRSSEVMEIGLTPNRTDAMSHWGVARELSAVMKQRRMEHTLRNPFLSTPQEVSTSLQAINIEAETECSLYSLTTIEIDPASTTPDWLKRNLALLGLKSIHPIVDITNWVQHELGQPSHAFDADSVQGSVYVRKAKENEILTTLDSVERKCSSEDVVIADDTRALCLAGVMGGLDSGVKKETSTILLECALFDSVKVRKSAKFHGIHSDSSFRFERGVDPEMFAFAQQRLIQLIIEIANGKVMSRSEYEAAPFTRNKVSFRPWKAHLILGKTLPVEEMESILKSLEFDVEKLSEQEWEIGVPGCRVDVTREIDLIEEILRIYSFDEIPPAAQLQFSWNQNTFSQFHIQHEIAKILVAQGFNEIQCLSLTKESHPAPSGSALIPILNPLSSDLGVLRTSLIHGGLETISFNIKRKNADLKIFEMGKVYEKTADGYREDWMLSIWMTGQSEKENSFGTIRPISFREMRNCIEQLAQMAGISISIGEKVEHSFFVECIQYPFKKGQFQLGWVADELLKIHDIEQPVLYLSLPLTPFMQLVHRHQPGSPQLHKFPSVRRDLSLLIDRSLLFQDIEKAAFQAEKKWLKEVFLFDVYEGDRLPQGKKSYAVGFILRDDTSTMNDQQIDLCMKNIISKLEENLGVELRG